jgi:imidazolonepropionase-like amidohydrolase
MVVLAGSCLKHVTAALTIAIAASIALCSCAQAQDAPGSVVIKEVRIFDGEKVIPGGTVLITGDEIAFVGENIRTPEDADIVDGKGMTLLPGLIDAHVHVWGEQVLRQALVFGVTTVVDMFMDPATMNDIKESQASGQGDDMAALISSGVLATAPGGHGTEYGVDIPTLTKPEEAQSFVDARIAEGSDFVKIIYDDGTAYGIEWPTLDEATLGAVVSAAHERGKLAVVHTGTLSAARTAIEAGADGLAHLYSDDTFDPDFGSLLAEQQAFVIATLSVLESISGTSGASALIDDPHISSYLTQASRSSLRKAFPSATPAGRKGYEAAERAVRQLRTAGVPILAGTDAPNPGTTFGASLHRELRLLVDAGLTPVEALRAATSVPAERFGIADRGRIEAGYVADILLVRGDPTQEIKATRDIVAVWKSGRRLDREACRREVEAEMAEIEEQKEAPPPPGSESGLISDFEPEEIGAEFGFGWSVSTDAIMGGSSTGDFSRAEGGAEGSMGSMLIQGSIAEGAQYPWAGAFFSPGVGFMTPANLSFKKAVTFWTKGDGKTYTAMVFAQSLGYMPSVRTFVAGPEWEKHTITFEQFGVEGYDITGIFFGGGSVPGNFIFQIDNIRLE